MAAMKELVRITTLERAQRLLHPLRVELLRRLAEPRTCAELAADLKYSQQRVNHHLKELRQADLIRIHHTRRVRNLLEATYIATAKAYWISPRLLRDPSLTAKGLRDQLSLNNLLVLAEAVQEEVGDLLEHADAGEEIPSFGLQLDISLRDDDERQRSMQLRSGF